jgi:hypothetical protein
MYPIRIEIPAISVTVFLLTLKKETSRPSRDDSIVNEYLPGMSRIWIKELFSKYLGLAAGSLERSDLTAASVSGINYDPVPV